MYEVELKVRADHAPVRERLDGLGAERRGVVRQVDTYYDAPHRDFGATDEAFRLRRELRDGEAVAMLTYKGPLVDDASKTREEHETTVGDGDEASAIAERLGFTPAATVEKRRERYAFDGFAVTLDAVTDLGTFVEVESDVEDEDRIDDARDDARAVLRRLDLDPDEGIRTSYLGLLLAE